MKYLIITLIFLAGCAPTQRPVKPQPIKYYKITKRADCLHSSVNFEKLMKQRAECFTIAGSIYKKTNDKDKADESSYFCLDEAARHCPEKITVDAYQGLKRKPGYFLCSEAYESEAINKCEEVK